MRIRSPFTRKLLPLAESLLKAHPNGVTVDDLHYHAIELGVLTGFEPHHQLSALGQVFKAAGAINTGKTLPSKMELKKGARQVVWARSPYRT